MSIQLKDYQEKKVEELVYSVTDLLSKSGSDKICVFQSPTGSGKTIMVAKFIEDLIKTSPDSDFCFLWISIGKGELHIQSKKSLERIFDGSPIVSLLEEDFFGSRNFIEKNEVVVGNWEKLRTKDRNSGEWKSKIMKDGDNINFIEVLQNTKEKRQIVLIIDESHYASGTERTNELRKIVDADVTLEMSATPKIQVSPKDIVNKTSYFIYVDPKDVIEEGMIKKELIINEGISNFVDDEKTSQELIIESAFNKRLELKDLYSSEGTIINPLCLIQLPNSDSGESKKESILSFLSSKGITESNKKVAIWLSDEKSDSLDYISDFDSTVEFLLFKQAIDTGWDCPRAQILVKLRDIQSFTFEVQTVGRILRMPEQVHYQNEKLNRGYIYTNIQSIEVSKEEYNPNIIKHLKSIRKQKYEPIKLTSYYKSRVDFGDITFSFGKILENVFCEEFGINPNDVLINIAENSEKIISKFLTLNPEPYNEKIIVDEILNTTNFDELEDKDFENQVKRTKLRLGDNDLFDVFNLVIRQNLNGFAPKRSIPTVRGAVYQWFKKYLGINYHIDNGIIKIQNLFLHPLNISVFSKLLSKSTGLYKPIQKEEIKDRIEEKFYEWDIKFEEFYNQYSDEVVSHQLYIYEPCYLSINRSSPEREFEKYIDNKPDKIDWWYKNGESKMDYLGIKYEENDLPRTFYPDYIVKLKSGKIFIGDTKSGITASDSKLKSESLQRYIKDENSKGKNLIGGIVVLDNTKSWRFNSNVIFDFDKNDLNEWDYFEDIL
jgi:type III restriction enzyme